jgi:hypothetical protein
LNVESVDLYRASTNPNAIETEAGRRRIAPEVLMPRPLPLAATLVFALVPVATARPADRIDELSVEVGRLRAQLIAVEGLVRVREEQLGVLVRELREMGQDVKALRVPAPLPMAGPFLSGPPLSSDTAGVAKVAVFAPRVEIDTARRHDSVSLRLRRIESDSVTTVGEFEIGRDVTFADVALDRSGALYVLEWSTSEGHSYNLQLKDGASGQIAATVAVKPLQAQGRFLFVGYRLE